MDLEEFFQPIEEISTENDQMSNSLLDQYKHQLEQAQRFDNVKDLFDAAASYLRYLGHSSSRSCRNFTEKQMLKSFGKSVTPTPIKSGLIYCHECSPNHQVKDSSFLLPFILMLIQKNT